MKVAICGNPNLGLHVKDFLKDTDIEISHFIVNEHMPRGGVQNLKPLTFFEFKRLNQNHLIDGVIIVDSMTWTPFSKYFVKTCKLHSISNVGVVDIFLPIVAQDPKDIIYWLDPDKAHIAYMETHVIDSCNLNCKACAHFSPLFDKTDFYEIENFKRDIRRISEMADVLTLRLLGGEPLLKDNLFEYVEIARSYLPKTNLRIATNGLLIPSASKKLFESMKKNNVVFDITMYPPTIKNFDKISKTLKENGIFCRTPPPVNNFVVFLTLNDGHNTNLSRAACPADYCRYLRDGKIYKCPIDGTAHRYKEKFKLKDFPNRTGIDIYTKNFLVLLEQLEGACELCNYCNEEVRYFPWKAPSKCNLNDWLF